MRSFPGIGPVASRTLLANLPIKQLLCLRLEIAAGVESPPEYAQARMEYQVARLSESLSGRDSQKFGNAAEEARKAVAIVLALYASVRKGGDAVEVR